MWDDTDERMKPYKSEALQTLEPCTVYSQTFGCLHLSRVLFPTSGSSVDIRTLKRFQHQ